jgi:hypothetical protein
MLKLAISHRGCFALIAFLLCSGIGARADTFHLEYPGGNDGSRPIVEFRARSPTLAPWHAGHAFIALGRELKDGTTIFYGVGGFYPQEETLKGILHSPGKVDYTVDDLHADETARFEITADQERAIIYVMKNWNNTEYAIASRNCLTLVKSVGKQLGLDVGDSKTNEMTPYDLIHHIKLENDNEEPLRHAVIESQRAASARAADGKVVNDTRLYIIKHNADVAAAQAEQNQWANLHSQWTAETNGIAVGIPMPGAGGGGIGGAGGGGLSPFTPGNVLSITWPWEPPKP